MLWAVQQLLMTPPHGPTGRARSRSYCTQAHLSDTATARQRVANGLGLRPALGDAPATSAGTGRRPGRAQGGRWILLAQFPSSCGADRQHRGHPATKEQHPAKSVGECPMAAHLHRLRAAAALAA